MDVKTNLYQSIFEVFENYYFQCAPFDELRTYCGKILVELFDTTLTIGYDDNTFID